MGIRQSDNGWWHVKDAWSTIIGLPSHSSQCSYAVVFTLFSSLSISSCMSPSSCCCRRCKVNWQDIRSSAVQILLCILPLPLHFQRATVTGERIQSGVFLHGAVITTQRLVSTESLCSMCVLRCKCQEVRCHCPCRDGTGSCRAPVETYKS